MTRALATLPTLRNAAPSSVLSTGPRSPSRALAERPLYGLCLTLALASVSLPAPNSAFPQSTQHRFSHPQITFSTLRADATLSVMQTFELVLLALLPISPLALSQPTAAPAIQTITLGNSAVPLTGPWKFQPGDSPLANGTPLWAQPAFDDSHWAPMDLTPQAGSVDMMLGTSGFVPGWTRKGYPDLSGFAWYRLRLRVKDAGQPLWLKMPLNFDDGYQVYANGRFVGQFGDFSGKHATLYYEKPISFALPAPGPDGEIDLAVRFYMSAATQFGNPDVGGMHGPPVLGLASTVQLLQASDQDADLHSQFGSLLEAFLFLLVMPLALWAWSYNRQERAWLWLFLALAYGVLISGIIVLSNSTTVLSVAAATWSYSILVLPLWTMFWWNWFGLREKRWIPRAAWLLAGVQTLLNFCAHSAFLGFSLVSLPALHGFNAAANWVGIPYQLLPIVILIEGYRRDRTEALLAAFPLLLGMYDAFGGYLLTAFHIPNQFFPFGLGIRLGNIVGMMVIVVVGALALRRFLRTQVRESLVHEAEKKDLEQAQQLQQRVLVPDTLHSPVFSIETEYRPAQTVGGDFFQTLSKPDGTLLLVIGDVSGKGVSAAMLVAVLVGAIRSQAEHTSDPSLMLAMLNRRMIGRAGGHFATCLAAEISPSGTMRIANAGHIPPYINGIELDLEGSLPLGILDDAEYTTQTLTLQPSDHLTFLTDGVIEATNPAHELFGFDRTRDISAQHASAIAQQAQTFGQEDDITVLGIAFAPA